MDDLPILDGYRALAAAVIASAIKDMRRGKVGARSFLKGEDAVFWLDALGVDQQAVLEALAARSGT